MSRVTGIVYNSNGEITTIRSGASESVDIDLAGLPHLIVTGGVNPETAYVKAGELRQRPPRPSKGYEWDNVNESWVLNLDEVKALRWEEIKQARSDYEAGGVTYAGSVFDSDMMSTLRVTGAGTLAQADPAGFSMDWTTKDNATVTLSGPEMIELGAAFGQHVNAGHVHARSLRAQINAATTEAEVLAVTWAL